MGKGIEKGGGTLRRRHTPVSSLALSSPYELYQYDTPGNHEGLLAATTVISASRDAHAQQHRPALSGASSRLPQAPPAERTASAPQQSVRVASASAKTRLANDVKYTFAAQGESIRDIAKRTNRRAADIVRYNERVTNVADRPIASSRIYLQPKRKSFRGKQKQHTVRSGETMQHIADDYALRTTELYARNRMTEGSQPRKGEKLQLRGKLKRRSVNKNTT